MRYRLIRFSKTNEVVLDVKCDAPNQFGDNELWHQETGGHAMLYCYGEKAWYELAPPDDQGRKRYQTWWAYPKDKELPNYIQMAMLVGAV